MAVNVNSVYQALLSEAVKDQQGSLNSTFYNNILPVINQTLFEFYFKQYEKTKVVHDAIKFAVEETILILSPDTVWFRGEATLPEDYRHDIQAYFRRVDNSTDQPVITMQTMDYMRNDEESYTLSSAVRKPSLAKNIFRYTVFGNTFYGYPVEVESVHFRYFRNPLNPVWGFTIVTTPNDEYEQYDPNTSVNFEFPEQQFPDILSLAMLYAGLPVARTELIQFAQITMAQPENVEAK